MHVYVHLAGPQLRAADDTEADDAEWRFQKATMRAFIESLSYARHIEREIDLDRGK